MKSMLLLALFCVFAVLGHATEVDSTMNLRIYYPAFSRIDLVCESMPGRQDKSVDFCSVAAFTGELLPDFRHTNIADNHISGGKYLAGYKCKANTGAFTWSPAGWKFMKKADFPTTAKGLNMGFCQMLILYNGQQLPVLKKVQGGRNVYRALCEKDGRLCLVESRQVVSFAFFVRCLKALHVKHALYLDMGPGWNYAWYRDKKGKPVELHPEGKSSVFYQYRTNWITFYK